MRMGLPRLLTTDQGSEFKNEIDKQMMKLLGIKRIFTTPYHPQVSLKYDSYVAYNFNCYKLRRFMLY